MTCQRESEGEVLVRDDHVESDTCENMDQGESDTCENINTNEQGSGDEFVEHAGPWESWEQLSCEERSSHISTAYMLGQLFFSDLYQDSLNVSKIIYDENQCEWCMSWR